MPAPSKNTRKTTAVKAKAPAVKAKAPAVKAKAPAVKAKAPAVKAKAPAVKAKAPAAKAKAPASKAKASPAKAETPSRLIDDRIQELGDWRGKLLARLRAVIHQADPEVVEEWKWRGVPVWSHDGILCTGETYKSVVKMTFAKGASLKDPSGLFNSSLEGNTRRAIDFQEGDKVDETALKALIRAAVALNRSDE
jgi:hypothetical protein